MIILYLQNFLSKYLLFLIFISLHLLNKEYCLINITPNANITPLALLIFMSFFLLVILRKKFYFSKFIIYHFILFGLGIIAWISAIKFLDLSIMIKYSYFQMMQIVSFITTYTLLFYSKNIAGQLRNSLFIIAFLNLIIFIVQVPQTLGSFNISYFGVFYGFDGYPRLMGFFSDPNYSMLYLGMHFYLAVLFGGITYRNYYIISIYALNVLLAFSRASILVNLIMIFIIIILFARNHFSIIWKALFGLSVCIVVTVFLLYRYTDMNDIFVLIDVENIIENRFDLDNEGSFNERSELLSIGLQAPSRYFFGIGIGQQQHYYAENYGVYKLAHNDFIGVLVEYGILGLIIYVIFYIHLFSKINRFSQAILLAFIINLFTLACYPYNLIGALVSALLLFERNVTNDKALR